MGSMSLWDPNSVKGTLSPMSLGFKHNDPAHRDFQYLEDLATAYWHSQVLFTALELELFFHIDRGFCSSTALANATMCREQELLRLLRAMEGMALVACHGNHWYNSQVSSLFLIPGKPSYMGDFFLYRKYMRPNWENLSRKIVLEEKKETDLTYGQRNDRYVAAMDVLVRQKAQEIADLVCHENIKGPILDVGGGAGSMIREIQKKASAARGVLFDIPEVIESARRLYPNPGDWTGITTMGGDFRTHEFKEKFSLIIVSNFLHAYGPDEAEALLSKAVGLLDRVGLILIHDYFPDLKGASPQKGVLYDLAMMLNTYNGVCHDTSAIIQWLAESDVKDPFVKELSTDSGVIMAARDNRPLTMEPPWAVLAMEAGFDKAVHTPPKDVVTGSWVDAKCRFGCANFNKNFQCPPHSMPHQKTRELLDSYKTAFLVQGTPPGKDFHDQLLILEKKAFLKGYHKAFVLGAGPCPVCPSCPDNCRVPHLARPSMEGSGIDVYATVHKAGWSLEPVRERGFYVKYIGLFLVE